MKSFQNTKNIKNVRQMKKLNTKNKNLSMQLSIAMVQHQNKKQIKEQNPDSKVIRRRKVTN